MGKRFNPDEVFPVIARLITKKNQGTGKYMSHVEIVASLLEDIDACLILDQAIASGTKKSRRGLAANMIAWFSQQITIGRSEWAPFFDRTKIDGCYAYRSVTSVETVFGVDTDIEAIEGEPRLVAHIRRERDRNLIRSKKAQVMSATARLACEACNCDFREQYPGINIDFCEVHHNRPLAESVSLVTTRLEDLSILCSNCHRMIHIVKPLPSVKEFRKLLKRERDS